jgi:hypothetical protein
MTRHGCDGNSECEEDGCADVRNQAVAIRQCLVGELLMAEIKGDSL